VITITSSLGVDAENTAQNQNSQTKDRQEARQDLLMEIGAKLRALRQQWQLSLRDVEERSLQIARERNNQSYQISSSWLQRLESGKHDLTVSKLITLASIYNMPPEQLIQSLYPGFEQPAVLKQLPGLDPGPLLHTSRREQTSNLRPSVALPQESPEATALLPLDNARASSRYRLGIIGMHDRTLEPRIPGGSAILRNG
jgi:transcriptional regulator with XRE-family HTH domain